MLDSHYKNTYQRLVLDPILKSEWALPVSPSSITITGCFSGALSAFFILARFPFLACCCLLLSAFFDTLDGSLARHTQKTSMVGASLDIFCDRMVEALILLALFLVSPTDRALPTILMFSSAYLCITAFLLGAVFVPNTSKKSFYYSPGLIERSEAIMFFLAMILLPMWFKPLALVFSALMGLTALMRMKEIFLASH